MRPFEPGYFGKLPLAADFLSRHAGDDEALAFERWLQEGVRATWERFSFAGKASQRELPSVRFIFWTKRQDAFLIGVLSQGRDRSGRMFHFAAFVQNRSPGLDACASAFPLAFDEFFTSMEGLAHRDIVTPPDLYQAVEEGTRLIPSPQNQPAFSIRAVLDGRSIGEIEDGGGGGIGAGQVKRALEDVLVLAGKGAKTGPTEFGLRLPLPDDPARAAIAAAFWIEAIRRAWSGPLLPTCFWTAGRIGESQRGWLDAYSMHPEALAYIHLLDPGFVSDLLIPLAGAPAPAFAVPELGPAEPKSWDLSPNRSLFGALDLLSGARG